MPKCSFCKSDTMEVEGCDGEVAYMVDKKAYARVPFGKEIGTLKLIADYSKKYNKACTHCNASHGNHHHSKCDMEECPKCHKQMALCGGHDARAVRLDQVKSAGRSK